MLVLRARRVIPIRVQDSNIWSGKFSYPSGVHHLYQISRCCQFADAFSQDDRLGVALVKTKHGQHRSGHFVLEWTIECKLGFAEHVSFNEFALFFFFFWKSRISFSNADWLGAVQLPNTEAVQLPNTEVFGNLIFELL